MPGLIAVVRRHWFVEFAEVPIAGRSFRMFDSWVYVNTVIKLCFLTHDYLFHMVRKCAPHIWLRVSGPLMEASGTNARSEA